MNDPVDELTAFLNSVEMTALDSEVVIGAGYNADRRILVLKMNSGKIYPYADVAVEIFVGILTADSPGKYYNRFIKGKFKAPEVSKSAES